MILDGQMVDPGGNGLLVENIVVGINEIKALFAFFQAPDNADLKEKAKKAAQESFTNSIKGIMETAKG
jgi:hypothetical protein